MRDHPTTLKGFIQHGVVIDNINNDQAIGNCVLCGKKGHFYINIENKMWDCKVCGKSGGFKTFLTYLVDMAQENFTGKVAVKLSKDRGIKLSTLREYHTGYNPYNDSYIIPVYDVTGIKIWDIRKFVKGRLYSTSGCKVGLYGWEFINKTDKLWLCEGEWDCLAARQYDKNAVAVPGANTFKSEWTALFKDKIVYVVYDNDDAGEKGMLKVYNNLISVVKELRFVNWPDSYKKGYDLRDYCFEKKSIGGLRGMLNIIPKGANVEEVKIKEDLTKNKRINPDELYSQYKKFLYMRSTDVIDVIYGSIIANRMEGDPLWMFLVAPSGSTKTEYLMSLIDSPKIVTATSLTSHTLISGMNFSGGGDPSLIPQLRDKVLVVKDFTTILTMNQTQRDEIFGILRDAYDGKTEKRFGNGVFRNYEGCKFGIIAGVTPAIEIFTDGATALGERFLNYRIPQTNGSVDTKELLKRAVLNVGNETKLRKEVQDKAKQVLSYDYKDIPEIPIDIIERLLCLAQWVADMRGTVVRDKYSKEITHKPFKELGTRLVKQFCKLILGIGMFRGLNKVTIKEYQIVKEIGIGSVPSKLEEFVKSIYRKGIDKAFSIDDFIDISGLPRITCIRVAEDLVLLKILKKKKISTLKYEFYFTDQTLTNMEGAEIYG